METLLTDFHFIRPLWLLGCIPAIVLFITLWFIRSRSSGWNRAIDQTLLPYLLDNTLLKQQNWPLAMVLLAWIFSCVSLAGPVWEKLPQPIQKKEDALILIQDLSLSMYAQDLSPDRLTRAQHKLADILQQRTEGTTAMVVYSGDAHIVSPLTDDSKTIAAMIPALSPAIMPMYGSEVTEAIKLALQLLGDAGISRGRLLLLTDEAEENDVREIAKLLRNKNVSLNVIGVGTGDGGPIPIGDGGFLKDNEGSIVVPRLNRNTLQQLARENNGRYSDIQLDDRDIEYLLAEDLLAIDDEEYRQLDREFDQWKEMGPWLLLGVLPVVLFAFRRGWLLSIIMLLTLGTGESQAMTWQDLWQRKDQQAAKALQEDNPQEAAELFQSPAWKGVAQYKANNFSDAAEAFGQNSDADSVYNNANALARAGNYEEAIKAYEKALELDPEMEDARFNKQLLEQLQQQQQQQNQENPEGQDQDKEQQQQDQQQSQQENQDKGEQEQGEQNEQSQDQQEEQHNSEAEQDQDSQQDDQQSQNAEQENNQQEEQAEQQQKQGEDKEQQEMSQQEAEEQAEEHQAAKQDSEDNQEDMNNEEKQALEQWLRQVPDNPGGLLRRKFEYESRQNRKQQSSQQDTKIW